ncbi:MAG: bifunctional (p)ppGpp synthetase/guanosine-3',5'-bis(diphosphate) 3'-pyrophosphohydrolase [Bacteroidales bacterium]|nr:bifunctional (p)ppGpp synthetase/guanosine-3',5'-bis(diphosphate) 3'-pyrophosphohydrolase [Bacteroidales bacterium]
MRDNINKRVVRIAESYQSEQDKELIIKSFQLTEDAVKDMTRGNGKPFIEHPIGVAEIVCFDLGLGATSVITLFIHEATRFKPELLDSIESDYSKEIKDMVIGLNKIAMINPNDTKLEAENYRKLIISYSKDPRVTLIKLADRLEVMRNIDLIKKSSQMKKVTETMFLYMPLAHKLGLYGIKNELEELAFKYNEPEQYRAITNKLKTTQKDRDELVKSFINPLKDKIDKEGIKYTLKARTKSAYSIWKKMQAQKVPFEGVYDVFAIRFIIDAPIEKEKDLCWKIYSLVTEEYIPDTKRLRDWISNPKANGYESLHTTVTNKDGAAIEVQIRSERMDYAAEKGNAAHWLYKGMARDNSLDEWLGKVRTILESPESLGDGEMETYAPNEVFVFTPDGDLRRLPAGASLLDFAFDIHTNLGIKCSGGRINGKQVSIREKLNTGDVIEIMKSSNQKPSQDWLNFVVTSKARSKIKQKIKEEEFKLAEIGKELVSRRMKNWKLEITDEELTVFQKKHKYSSLNELYAAIGTGTIDISEIKDFVTKENNSRPETAPTISKEFVDRGEERKKNNDYLVIGSGVKNLDYTLAKCCNPIYGDDVFGFISTKGGIKIHRISCPNASRLIDNYPYRIQKVKWNQNVNSTSFQTSLRVSFNGEEFISNKVIETINAFKVSIRSFAILDKNRGAQDISITISVPSNQELDKIIQALKRLKGVYNVTRSSR